MNLDQLNKQVTLSPWVNEPLPPLSHLLTAHDVARLTRRPRWMLLGLAILGRFPRKRRYRGQRVGWLRSDIVEWVIIDLQPDIRHRASPVQQNLPLWHCGHSRARARRRRRVGRPFSLNAPASTFARCDQGETLP
jgi:predicted DNA-binding transcriptional regulator AlpA